MSTQLGTDPAARKLHEILAIRKDVASNANRVFTAAYHNVQKTALLAGIARTYQPLDDEGEQFPPESNKVQLTAQQLITEVSAALTRMFDVTLTQDVGNTKARADIVIDGSTLAVDVPVSYLLFLEKQLVDLRTFITKLPVLDPAENWAFDGTANVFKNESVKTAKSKKIPRNHVKAPATEKHPAQVEIYFEDKVVGYWTTTKYSGALPQAQINRMLARVNQLSEAVKQARERANSVVVTDQHLGKRLLDFVLVP